MGRLRKQEIIRSAIALSFLLSICAGCMAPIEKQKMKRYSPNVSSKDVILPSRDADRINKQIRQPMTLKSGDEMMISMRGIPVPENIKNVIDGAGKINLPLVGTMKVEGLTSSEAEKAIEKAYIEGDYYKKINIIIVASQGEYFIGGEVKNEGKYSLSGDLTLLQAVTSAGGYTDYAKKNQIKIKRGDEILYFNADKIEKIQAKDPLIKEGDIITVRRRLF